MQDFLQELLQTRVTHKDREAESMILQAIAHQPDAPYLLVQKNLIQEQAIDAAKREIAALRSQIEQTKLYGNASFLNSSSDWSSGNRRYSSNPAERSGTINSVYGYAAGSHHYPTTRPGLLDGGMGSFLGSMAATAAGVAAGSFLFHGMDDFFNDHDRPASLDTADSNDDNAGPFMDDNGADYGGLAGDAGIDDIGGMEDFS